MPNNIKDIYVPNNLTIFVFLFRINSIVDSYGHYGVLITLYIK